MYAFQRPNTVQKQAPAGAVAGGEREQQHPVTAAASRQIFASYGHTGFTSRTVHAPNAVHPRA